MFCSKEIKRNNTIESLTNYKMPTKGKFLIIIQYLDQNYNYFRNGIIKNQSASQMQ